MRKITIKNPLTPVIDYLTQSISRLIMAAFVLVLLLPVFFILASLNKNAWQDVHQSHLAKQLLIAKSLAEPVKLYLISNQHLVQSLAHQLKGTNLEDHKNIRNTLNNFTNNHEDIIAATFVSPAGNTVLSGTKDKFSDKLNDQKNKPVLSYLLSEKKYRQYDSTNSISGVFKSSITKQPAILIKQHIFDEKLSKSGTLFVEVKTDYLVKICSQVAFGENGHCVLVDKKSQVVAHPDKNRVNQIKNISSDKIVKKMMNGESGETEYLSPSDQTNMLVAFAAVDNLGWGVMVLQPKSEIDLPVAQIKSAILNWAIAGAILALLVAYLLTRQITKPLKSLAIKSKEIDVRSDSFQLESPPKRCPSEISLLWNTLSKLILNFQKSNMEVKKLNYSLNNDFKKIAAQLRDKKQYLLEINNRDPLTDIANRNCFRKELAKVLRLNRGDKVGIILLDIDDFKYLNVVYSHLAGDATLKHLARILHRNTRSGDMAARYGGDEFILFIKNCTPKSLLATAEKLRTVVEKTPVSFEGKKIKYTISIGTVFFEINLNTKLDFLLKGADKALHEAKLEGQNHVYTLENNLTEKKPTEKACEA